MKKALRWLALAAVLLIAVVGLVVVSGVVPVKASSGHLPITAWMLNFAMERSVSTHSSGIAVPPLADAALVMRGAGHYEIGCLWCHGGPNSQVPRVAMQMTPHPPELTAELEKWQPEELFTIVRHGVKFTAMPAWPSSHRDDEVWAVVAFLERFPKMTSAEYLQLSGRTLRDEQRERVRQPPEQTATVGALPPTLVIERCVACHDTDGLGRGAYPKLAGQTSEYMIASLRAYRDGQRHSGTMGPIAAALSDNEISQVAAYYHALRPATSDPNVPSHAPATEGSAGGDAESLAQGERIARDGLVKERAGACLECHSGAKVQRNLRYPKLAGQYEDYLVQQLRLFRSNDRGGSDRAHIMHNIAEAMTDGQIDAVAKYFALQTADAADQPPKK